MQVIKLMQSFKSKEYVKEIFSWQYYYYYLTNEGIEYLREYLNLGPDVVPDTLKKSARPAGFTTPSAKESNLPKTFLEPMTRWIFGTKRWWNTRSKNLSKATLPRPSVET